MTRSEILSQYKTDPNSKWGRITSPGKFEGQPAFAPALWELGLSGFSDADNGRIYTFRFPRNDPMRQEWPELDHWLGQRKRAVRLAEDSLGFVRCF